MTTHYSKFIMRAEKAPDKSHSVHVRPKHGIGFGTLSVQLSPSPHRRVTKQRWRFNGRIIPASMAELMLNGFTIDGMEEQ